ncbi:unnamed protein product (macronuclear) [Paramecium tetraurelia]|uniref:GHMP kinase C-terminal domain-containing protein n=1 Tax=Paramecium tetraurelia TaxID=5888 RepID=A0BBH8_PARTE|nr:uncharacterized protein GSPATT00000330001 [Paramecium tetraurelia]CAK55895.1 unnamed protein product [Paramecium tetraurelia]|eukprot:XP_001423293.1 hypothetical protein (macronuclear) [Paramecium tetraurelia strain d4-2]
MFVRAPAKIIISGEHSVVYGHKALCAAINKYTKIKIHSNKANSIEIRWGNDWHEVLNLDSNNTNSQLAQVARILNIKPSIIEVESEDPQPLSAVALSKAMNGSIEQAIEIENIFHGKRGSGLDVQVTNHGGICIFQIGKPIQKVNLPIQNILLIDSGDRKQKGTEGSIAKVKNCVEQKDGRQILNRISEVTEQIIKEGLVKELIYENHDLLNRLGICTDRINDIIRICKREGVPAKMTGAGDGGFCIAFPKDEQESDFLVSKLHNYKTLKSNIDKEGCKII